MLENNPKILSRLFLCQFENADWEFHRWIQQSVSLEKDLMDTKNLRTSFLAFLDWSDLPKTCSGGGAFLFLLKPRNDQTTVVRSFPKLFSSIHFFVLFSYQKLMQLKRLEKNWFSLKISVILKVISDYSITPHSFKLETFLYPNPINHKNRTNNWLVIPN